MGLVPFGLVSSGLNLLHQFGGFQQQKDLKEEQNQVICSLKFSEKEREKNFLASSVGSF